MQNKKVTLKCLINIQLIIMNEKLILTNSQKISLREHPHFDEQWLRKVIEDDPSIIGLGDLELKEAERIQPKQDWE